MSHTREPWVAHLYEGGAWDIRLSDDPMDPPVLCSRGDWSNRAVESHANAARIVACVNALAGLTPEQVAAIPRLVAWARRELGITDGGFLASWLDLRRIFGEAK